MTLQYEIFQHDRAGADPRNTLETQHTREEIIDRFPYLETALPDDDSEEFSIAFYLGTVYTAVRNRAWLKCVEDYL